jgi:hypothetical protein
MDAAEESYYDRYIDGDYVNVWAELTAFGAAVRQEPLYSDALAVARETMRRARHNLATLIDRLPQIGYQLIDGDEILVDPAPTIMTDLDALEATYGLLPLSLRTWYEQIHTVSLVGVHPKLNRSAEYEVESQSAPIADPLAIAPLWAYARTFTVEEPFQRIFIAADSIHKAGYSGGGWTEMIFPNPVMDTPLLGDDWPGMLFTNYLRLVFEWGGFPGLSRLPEDAAAAAEELAFFTNDLLPL